MKQFDRTAKWVIGGLAAAVALSGLGVATAGTSGPASTYNAMTPCRLMDTRPGPDQVGPRSTPLGAAEELTVQVRGSNGECSIPADADAVTINVIAVNPTDNSFLSIWPADSNNSGTSSLNYLAGQPPTPNFITTALSAGGAITLFNQFGTVDVVVDVFGFYSDHTHDDRYYTRTQTDGAVAAIEAEVDAALGAKADAADVYTKAQTDGEIAATEAAVDAALDTKADADDVYTKTEVYTKIEVDDLYPTTYISTETFVCADVVGCPGGTYIAPIATCDNPVSDILTGGGARVEGTSTDRGSFPSGVDGEAPAGWTSDVDLDDGDQLVVYAICATNE